MKKFVLASITAAAALTLGACGSTDGANEAATAENVEMPAEEAMTEVEPAAAPVADPSANATGNVADLPNGPVPDASANAAADAAAAPSGTPAAEKPAAEADKKM